jgi:hypothetical protein
VNRTSKNSEPDFEKCQPLIVSAGRSRKGCRIRGNVNLSGVGDTLRLMRIGYGRVSTRDRTPKYMRAERVAFSHRLGKDTALSASREDADLSVLFDSLAAVRFEVGSMIQVAPGGVSVFRIIEIGVDGDPTKALVEAVADTPGTYPWPTDLTYAVPAEQP